MNYNIITVSYCCDFTLSHYCVLPLIGKVLNTKTAGGVPTLFYLYFTILLFCAKINQSDQTHLKSIST